MQLTKLIAESETEVNTMTGEATQAQETGHAEEAKATPHISIKADTLFEINHFPITNSILTSVIVTILFIALAMYYSSQIGKTQKSKFFFAMNGLLKVIYGLFESVLKNKITVFFPLLGAFFMFVLLNNWFGLLPGIGSLMVSATAHGETHLVPLFRGGTADLNATVALALISVVVTQMYGFKYLGPKHHIGKYFNFKSPIDFLVGLFEIISEFSRILSFSFRLFGNVLAGEVLLVILAFLLPTLVSFISSPMYFMEIFVGFIQALVFSMLTAVFISMAIEKHH